MSGDQDLLIAAGVLALLGFSVGVAALLHHWSWRRRARRRANAIDLIGARPR